MLKVVRISDEKGLLWWFTSSSQKLEVFWKIEKYKRIENLKSYKILVRKARWILIKSSKSG